MRHAFPRGKHRRYVIAGGHVRGELEQDTHTLAVGVTQTVRRREGGGGCDADAQSGLGEGGKRVRRGMLSVPPHKGKEPALC